jgi:hypothetical protein
VRTFAREILLLLVRFGLLAAGLLMILTLAELAVGPEAWRKVQLGEGVRGTAVLALFVALCLAGVDHVRAFRRVSSANARAATAERERIAAVDTAGAACTEKDQLSRQLTAMERRAVNAETELQRRKAQPSQPAKQKVQPRNGRQQKLPPPAVSPSPVPGDSLLIKRLQQELRDAQQRAGVVPALEEEVRMTKAALAAYERLLDALAAISGGSSEVLPNELFHSLSGPPFEQVVQISAELFELNGLRTQLEAAEGREEQIYVALRPAVEQAWQLARSSSVRRLSDRELLTVLPVLIDEARSAKRQAEERHRRSVRELDSANDGLRARLAELDAFSQSVCEQLRIARADGAAKVEAAVLEAAVARASEGTAALKRIINAFGRIDGLELPPGLQELTAVAELDADQLRVIGGLLDALVSALKQRIAAAGNALTSAEVRAADARRESEQIPALKRQLEDLSRSTKQGREFLRRLVPVFRELAALDVTTDRSPLPDPLPADCDIGRYGSASIAFLHAVIAGVHRERRLAEENLTTAGRDAQDALQAMSDTVGNVADLVYQISRQTHYLGLTQEAADRHLVADDQFVSAEPLQLLCAVWAFLDEASAQVLAFVQGLEGTDSAAAQPAESIEAG